MDGHKFRSGLTEVKGDGIHKCITMSKFCFDLLTSLRTSRAASLQLKTGNYNWTGEAFRHLSVLVKAGRTNEDR